MILFWCEFPESIDWKRLNKLLKKRKLKVRTYITSISRRDYEKKRKDISKYSNIKVEGVWPILTKARGYWFSGFTRKKDINLLDEFEGVKMKIDIEPPIPATKSLKGMYMWLLKHLFKKQNNRKYLMKKVRRLARSSKIILSSFPFPLFMLKRYGFFLYDRLNYNYIFYSTFVPEKFKKWYFRYYKRFVKRKLKQDRNAYFALGLLAPGIFQTEPIYKNVNEFVEDYKFLKGLGVKNFVIFRLGALVEMQDPEPWI
jgi:hypothetical protein